MDEIDAAIQDRALATLALVRALKVEIGQYGRVTTPWLTKQLAAIEAFAETGEMPERKVKRCKSLVEFLIGLGGLSPNDKMAGDLKAIDATGYKHPKLGKLVRKGGMKLDKAREAAAEAGYLREDDGINELLIAVDDLINTTARKDALLADIPF